MAIDDLDPTKYHVLTPSMRRFALIVAAVFVFILLPVFGYFYYNFAITRQAQAGRGADFVIKDGDSVSEIAQNLYEQDFINSSFLFKFYIVANQLQNALQAGVYAVPPGASVVELVDLFKHGTDDQVVTFLEGWRVEEIALHAANKFEKVDFENLVILAKDSEGFLFPDTYFFNSEVDESTVLETMKSTFNSKTAQVLTPETLAKLEMTQEEVVTFASIVEREVRNPDDRPIVAGILINRWRNGELIGADATTQYAAANVTMCSVSSSTGDSCIPTQDSAITIDWWPVNITLADLALESPYNTRKVTGLPPTPIANPGLSAIEAVINHKTTEYNYYLTDNEGITHYARTLEEHNANVIRYL